MTLEQLLRAYLKSHNFLKLSEKSKAGYTHCADKIVEYLGDVDLKSIKRSDLIRFMNENSGKPAFANLAIRVASVLFSYAVDLDEMPFNPALRVKKFKGGSHKKWTAAEVASVISLNDRKVSCAVALAWYTGQRESDILAMRWDDLKDGYISMVQEKTKLEMKIKAHPDLVAYLQTVRGVEPGDYYMVSGQRPMKPSAFRMRLKRKLSEMSIDKVFHGIRKGVASSLAENGRSLNEIAAIMGHKSIRMAAYYSEQASGDILRENAVSHIVSCVD